MSGSNKCGMYYSDLECSILMDQVQRRAKYREIFLRQKTDPRKHADQAGYVFDPAIQRFNSMKATQLYNFKPNFRTSLFGVCSIILPMFTYGYLLYNDRAPREKLIRSGQLRYKDRLFKLQ